MNQKDIFLTIVVPVYNIKGELLYASLRSVVDKKNDAIEIIVVDDGSTNGASEICDKFANIDNNVYIYHQENQGVSVARNLGIEKAHGNYICFVDSDDIVQIDVVFSVAKYAKNNKFDICFFKYRRDDSFTTEDIEAKSAGIRIKDTNELVYNIASQNEPYDGYCIGSPWGKVFRKDFLLQYNLRFLPSLRKMQDRVFMMYCLERCPSVDFVALEGYCYIRNEESIVNNYNSKIGIYLSNVGREIRAFNNKHSCMNNKQINTVMCKLLNEYLGLDILHRKNKKSIIEKEADLKKYVKENEYYRALKNYIPDEFDFNARIKLWLIKHRLYYCCIVMSGMYSRIKR
ncbi:MAG: glycosyltransferase [Lachnospiraceae bacterium]|nr:glycosyltransferase [Lachnospiraceae bacterium]